MLIVTQSYAFAEVVMLPKFTAYPAQTLQQILGLSLDVLIFTEVGMVHDIFFLAHSRLAKRTLSFWGHAITSGIVDFAYLMGRAAAAEKEEEGEEEEEGAGELSHHRGGPDYFISSVLFEACLDGKTDTGNSRSNNTSRSSCSSSNECYALAQQKYSERLLLQEGLTTYFLHPPLPLAWHDIDPVMPPPSKIAAASENRIPLLPDKLPFLAYFQSSGGRTYDANLRQLRDMFATYGIAEHAFRLYCIPQTLYKLSPGNIDLVRTLLVADASGVVVLLDGEASHPEQKQLIMQAFPPASLARVVFLRTLRQREYMTLLAIADVVLDTFPVGGGRSSFAIFSTGTPIVMLYPATSILQLTYGMYRTMGIECSLCIAYDEETYIASSIEIASNQTLQRTLRGEILQHKVRLYENKTVIEEWEHMLRYVMSIPRPVPFSFASTSASASASELKASLSVSTVYSGNSKDTDEANWLQDLKRIYHSSNNNKSGQHSAVTFEEWVQALPLNISLALSAPYPLQPPIRLSSVAASAAADMTPDHRGVGVTSMSCQVHIHTWKKRNRHRWRHLQAIETTKPLA